jgi:hypothetical protein
MSQEMQGAPKHLKGFWPIFIILVVAVVSGLLVYWFQFQLVNDYETQGMELRIHRRESVTKKVPVKKTPVQMEKK